MSDVTLAPGGSTDVAVHASDPDGGPLTFSLMFGPAYAALLQVDDYDAAVHLGPAPSTAERWIVSVQVADPSGASDTRSFRVLVDPADGSPVANVNGPFSTRIATTFQLDSSGSSDPGGEALTYMWDFGDGYTTSEPNPSHAYGRVGLFPIVLRVTDTDGRTASAHTWAFQYGWIMAVVRPFVLPPDDHLRPGRPLFRVFIESEQAEQLIPESITLGYQGGSIQAVSSKHSGIGDADANGVPDYAAYFNTDDVYKLLSSIPQGRNQIRFDIGGQIMLAGGDLDLKAGAVGSFMTEVTKGGQVSFTAPSAKVRGRDLVLNLETDGPVTLQVFDVQGRLIRAATQGLSGGAHVIPMVDGRPAAGVYFYRLRMPAGESSGRFVVVK